ncbi:hypothetical protein [Lacinutrix salivirga]
MKTLLKTTAFLALILFIIASCSKDEPTPDPGNQGEGELIQTTGQVTEDDFETYEGDIGVVIDARPLARKGYKPTQVTLNITGEVVNFTETIPLDEDSYMGQLKLPLENLSDADKGDLIDGVNIIPEYKDENGAIIYTEPLFTKTFLSNPEPRTANVAGLQETEENQTLSFRPGTSYYIQRMNADGSPDSGSMNITASASLDNVISATSNATFDGTDTQRIFTFHPVPNNPNTFLIRHAETGRFIRYAGVTTTSSYSGSFFGMKLRQNTNLAQIEAASDYHHYQFTFEKQDNGTFIIKNSAGLPVKQAPGFGLTFDDTITNTTSGNVVTPEDRTWRMVSTSIDWTISNISTSFLEPILPPAETSLSINSVLTNCGSGTLSQTVGVAHSENQQRTVGFEETLSATTSNSFGVNVSLNVEFSAQILGTGTTVNAGIDTSYDHSWSSTETSSEWESTHTGQTQEITSTRTVTVPSGSASLVYDVVQFYPETRVNFAQRLRVEGIDSESGLALTGEEIRTLFYVNGFNGVVSAVEPNSMVVTLRGTLTLDKIIDSDSNVQDVPANCN